MKASVATLTSCLLFTLCSGSKARVTPVQKAIDLLNGMLSKAGDAKHEEAVQYAAFSQFCSDVSTEKTRLIEEAENAIEQLKADVLKYDTEVERLQGEIETHDTEVAGWEQDLEAAHKVRSDEGTNYTVTHADYQESIDALSRAISTLKAQNYDRPGTAGLLQKVKQLPRLPAAARKTIEVFLSRDSQDPDDTLAPEVPTTAYEFQSGDIITMLEQLKETFMDEKRQLEQQETASRHSYDSVVQSLTDSISAGKKAREEAVQGVHTNQQASIDANGQLQVVTATHDDDVKYLNDLTSTCQTKSAEFESRQKLRQDEIAALTKAVELLSSEDVTGNAEKHLPSALVQRLGRSSSSKSLAQLRAQSSNPDNQLRVAAYLMDQAEHLGSKTLSVLATKLRDDPFGKVKKLIEELITRLMSQATAEAEHKGWCDTELATNLHTRETKSAEVETLGATIDSLQSRIEVLTNDLAALNQAIADIDAAVAKATELRNNETVANNATVQDAKDGQTAIEQAINVLKDFYDRASEATALAQRRARQPADAPPIFDSPYQGLQAESGGVVGMLQVIKSDFARLESDTNAAEAAAQNEYDKFMEDSSIDKAQKEQDVQHYTSEKANKEGELTEAREKLTEAQSLLNSAMESFEKLKPACIDTGMSYEERVSRRREEIAALQEALRILSGEDIAALNQQ